tara:strand:+ start:670 stop:1062 length:393 start_codon:yes stop_codon:yes gene_type:complete
MSQKSYEAFKEQIESGQKENDATRIYLKIIEMNVFHQLCNKESLSKALNKPHQTITARLSDLMDLGVVEIVIKNGFKTTTLSSFKTVTDPISIKANWAGRQKEKFDKWLRKGKEFGIEKSRIIEMIRDNY